MGKRKIVQIAPDFISTGVPGTFLWALCDDGSVWVIRTDSEKTQWVRHEDIPQE